jgi:hypothetical protein
MTVAEIGNVSPMIASISAKVRRASPPRGEVCDEGMVLADHHCGLPRGPWACRSAWSGSACQSAIGTTKQGWPVRASRCLRRSSAISRVWSWW